MSKDYARGLYMSGRSHGLAAHKLFDAAHLEGVAREVNDPEQYAHSGPYSLSIHNLVGLSFELMLKAAYVASGGPADDKHLQLKIGHDLILALNRAEKQGFQSEAPYLRDILKILRKPYKAHYFRYSRPNAFALPEIDPVVQALDALDYELDVLCAPDP